MRPLNSKERSKKVWQFIFIFFGLALVPVALIFFAYWRLPQAIGAEEDQKLVAYSAFAHTEKKVTEIVHVLDSCIGKLDSLQSGPNEESVLINETSTKIAKLGEIDTNVKMMQMLHDVYEKYLKAVQHKNQALLDKKTAEEKLKGVVQSPIYMSPGMAPPIANSPN